KLYNEFRAACALVVAARQPAAIPVASDTVCAVGPAAASVACGPYLPLFSMTQSIPDGFEPWRPSSPFMTHLADLGAFYRRTDSNVLAVRVAEPHTNMHNIAHGGLLATLADSALGYCIVQQAQVSVVTVQMSGEYLNAVKQIGRASCRERG